MTPKIVDKEKRRQEILLAAFEIFGRKGYHEATLSEIARAAGMGQGTLYYYFPTKEEIFWGVYGQLMSYVEEKIRTRLAMLGSSRERLEEMVRLMFRSFPEVGYYEEGEEDKLPLRDAMMGFSLVLMEFWLQAERSGKREEFYARLRGYQLGIVSTLQELLEEVSGANPLGMSSEMVAHILIALRDGFSLQLRMGTISMQTGLLEQLREALFRWLKKHYEADGEEVAEEIGA